MICKNFKIRGRGCRWLLLVAVLGLITYFSRQPFAEQDLRPQIGRYGRIINLVQEMPPVSFFYGRQLVNSREPVEFIQFWLRKSAHILIYALLSLALFSVLDVTGLRGIWRWAAVGLIVALLASIDEWRQVSVPGRTGQPLDVLADIAGFLVFTLGLGFYKLVIKKENLRDK